MSIRILVPVALMCLFLTGSPVAAQPLGTFRWQQQPYCNVMTVNVVQSGAVYQLDGTDDQCGAATQGAVVGMAFVNPNGTVGLGMTLVTTPGGMPLHIDATISVATASGTWRDSSGATGAFVLTPGAAAPGGTRPLARTTFPGGLSAGGTTITNVAAPVAATDAATKGYVDDADAAKAGTAYVDAAVAPKANTAYVDAAVAAKASMADVAAAIAASTANVDAAIAAKADRAYVDAAVAPKANTAYVDAALAAKANTADMNAALATKASTAYVDAALAAKANTADVDAALATKANIAYVDAALATKANTADVVAAIAAATANVKAAMLSDKTWPMEFTSGGTKASTGPFTSSRAGVGSYSVTLNFAGLNVINNGATSLYNFVATTKCAGHIVTIGNRSGSSTIDNVMLSTTAALAVTNAAGAAADCAVFVTATQVDPDAGSPVPPLAPGDLRPDVTCTTEGEVTTCVEGPA